MNWFYVEVQVLIWSKNGITNTYYICRTFSFHELLWDELECWWFLWFFRSESDDWLYWDEPYRWRFLWFFGAESDKQLLWDEDQFQVVSFRFFDIFFNFFSITVCSRFPNLARRSISSGIFAQCFSFQFEEDFFESGWKEREKRFKIHLGIITFGILNWTEIGDFSYELYKRVLAYHLSIQILNYK
jgi:hypothetical protein